MLINKLNLKLFIPKFFNKIKNFNLFLTKLGLF